MKRVRAAAAPSVPSKECSRCKQEWSTREKDRGTSIERVVPMIRSGSTLLTEGRVYCSEDCLYSEFADQYGGEESTAAVGMAGMIMAKNGGWRKPMYRAKT